MAVAAGARLLLLLLSLTNHGFLLYLGGEEGCAVLHYLSAVYKSLLQCNFRLSCLLLPPPPSSPPCLTASLSHLVFSAAHGSVGSAGAAAAAAAVRGFVLLVRIILNGKKCSQFP